MTTTTSRACEARRLRVSGIVQGVGFRPFAHRLATRLALAGTVRNRAGDVEIVIEGEAAALDEYLAALVADAPPLARIDAIASVVAVPSGLTSFTIAASDDDPTRRQPVPADVAICGACEAELRDPNNRRYAYPFITCTDCGPRYSVIEAIPYDRERTSMRRFAQCADCRREYESPDDRRHHSESNSCPRCGPTLRFLVVDALGGATDVPGDPLASASSLLLRGGIVAVRGMGGFHLAADATNDAAVCQLRARKRREHKPFALMVRDLAEAGAIVVLSDAERGWLASRERPIVLARRAPATTVSAAVAPDLDSLGIMLPSTPLHQLLLERVGHPLVMTSGNLSAEPLAADNDDALERLRHIADGFLVHDREVVNAVDDSVLRASSAGAIVLRRARGYAPLPLTLPVASPVPLVAVGAQLKNTFTLADGRDAYVSPHLGDLDDLCTLDHFARTRKQLAALFRITPRAIAYDAHPGYLSTRLACESGIERAIAVQHHHAHIAAVMAEHDVTSRVLGVAFDGTGYGTDGTVWGAEWLVADLTTFERAGHLRPAPLPGGDLAVRTPWRAAAGYLSLDPTLAQPFAPAFIDVDQRERAMVEIQIARRINTPLASSMGRLFDAAAAILGVCSRSRYEGEAATRLEALAGNHQARALPFTVTESDGRLQLDPLPLLAELGTQRERGVSPATLAAAFHETIIAATALMTTMICEAASVATVALGGGSFQNARLTSTLYDRLTHAGLRVILARRLPPNDGGISYGQAAIAAAILARESGMTNLRGS
ncbi:MAG: carbamoyltransferase HypF [Gemmatimonadota bacterium]|nr:carbamoyltransferase HypF [Gemmatimonadota bacterium]